MYIFVVYGSNWNTKNWDFVERGEFRSWLSTYSFALYGVLWLWQKWTRSRHVVFGIYAPHLREFVGILLGQPSLSIKGTSLVVAALGNPL